MNDFMGLGIFFLIGFAFALLLRLAVRQWMTRQSEEKADVRKVLPQYLRCREPGCLEEVVYKPKPVFGSGKYVPADRLRIYLTCSRRHLCEYAVWPYIGHEVKYYLVGQTGAAFLGAGEATLIKRLKTANGFRWSYLYHVSAEDEAWRKEQAPTPANSAKRLFWGTWSENDLVKGGRYHSVQEITEGDALLMIQDAPIEWHERPAVER